MLGYVIMPEHIHLLISESQKGDPSKVMQAIKQGFARRVLKQARGRRNSGQGELFGGQAEHVWQHHFYDFNVWSERKRIEKLRYIHDNPVRRGLVLEPEQWAWSSYRAYAFGEVGVVKLNQWPQAKLKKGKVRHEFIVATALHKTQSGATRLASTAPHKCRLSEFVSLSRHP